MRAIAHAHAGNARRNVTPRGIDVGKWAEPNVRYARTSVAFSPRSFLRSRRSARLTKFCCSAEQTPRTVHLRASSTGNRGHGTHDNAIGIVTGLVLLASVLAMIGSMNALARTLRVPDAEAEIAQTRISAEIPPDGAAISAHRRNWNATSAAIITAPPSACSGVITSPRNSALPMVASSGSRFMNSAVRNGPIRMVETNTENTATTVADARGDHGGPAERGLRRLPVERHERGQEEERSRGEERIPRDQPRIGAGKLRARHQQDDHAAARGAEREHDAGERDAAGMRADHQREPEKRGDRRRHRRAR